MSYQRRSLTLPALELWRSTHLDRRLFTTTLISMRVHPYLRLVRLPNVLTAIADCWAGYFFCLAASSPPDWPSLLPLLFASACLYAGGIAMNDLCDLRWDREQRPERPLPRGEISVVDAVRLIAGLFLAALVASGWVGLIPFVVSVALSFSIFIYNRISKTLGPLAAINMGLCRGLNFLLGAAAIPSGLSMAWPAACFIATYIFLVTSISQKEDAGVSRARLLALLVLLPVVPLASAFLYLPSYFLYGAPIILVLALALGVRSFQLWKEVSPASVGRLIKTAILGLVLFDAAFVLGNGHVLYGLVCLALIIPSMLLGRKITMT